MSGSLNRLVVVLCLVVASSCGYALAGRGNALPSYIKAIGVPLFVNHSTTANIDRVLTDAVSAEFQSKGKYLVQPKTTGVDAVLTGIVTNVVFQPIAFTVDRQASAYQIIVVANLEFKDLKDDKVLWTNQSFRSSPEEYQVTTGTTANDPTALFNQQPTALDRLAKRFAREVVTSVFEAF